MGRPPRGPAGGSLTDDGYVALLDLRNGRAMHRKADSCHLNEIGRTEVTMDWLDHGDRLNRLEEAIRNYEQQQTEGAEEDAS
jgi:hypothetical protein